MKRIVVKVGSNVITRPDGTLDVTRMSALVDQIAWLRSEGWQVVLISSGAVAAGRNEVTPSRKLDTVSQRQLYSAVGQAKLINRYYQLFRDHGYQKCLIIQRLKHGDHSLLPGRVDFPAKYPVDRVSPAALSICIVIEYGNMIPYFQIFVPFS